MYMCVVAYIANKIVMFIDLHSICPKNANTKYNVAIMNYPDPNFVQSMYNLDIRSEWRTIAAYVEPWDPLQCSVKQGDFSYSHDQLSYGFWYV